MKHYIFSIGIALSILFLSTSCNQKCYDCSRDCGTCTRGFETLFGCEGDAALSGFSLQTWKFALESQGYTCNIEKITETDICNSEERKELEARKYSCKQQ